MFMITIPPTTREMAAIAINPRLGGADQPQVRFVDQRGGVEGLARLFPIELLGRQLAQLVIHQRQELFGGLRIASFNLRQNAGDVGHRAAGREIANDG